MNQNQFKIKQLQCQQRLGSSNCNAAFEFLQDGCGNDFLFAIGIQLTVQDYLQLDNAVTNLRSRLVAAVLASNTM